jgi:hypothetical protein
MQRITYYYYIASIVTLLVLSQSAYCQKKIFLRDADSKNPVEYANVFVGNVVYYTDKDGSVDIPDETSQIKISHICYKDTMVMLSQVIQNVVSLSPKAYDIPEIVVGKPKFHKQRYVGLPMKKESLYFGGRSGMSVGVYLPYQDDYEGKAISGIIADLYDAKTIGVYDQKEKVVLRFDLRLPDADTKAPSDYSLIEGGILYDGKSGRRTSIPLEYPISFPRQGIYVVIEWMVEGECKTNVLYNPHLRMSKSDKPSVSWDKKAYIQQGWTSWDEDKALEQFKSSLQTESLNANVGLLLYE